MAANRKTKTHMRFFFSHLHTATMQGEFLHNYYMKASLDDGGHDGIDRIFVHLPRVLNYVETLFLYYVCNDWLHTYSNNNITLCVMLYH